MAMTLLLFALLAVTALTIGLLLMESRMIYFPLRALEDSPDRHGWAYEDVRLRSSDGVSIHGWLVAGVDRNGVTPPGPRRICFLFLHGNGGNISHRLEKIRILLGLGADVLIVDYRGYGRSEGKPDEEGLALDARAAYDHLAGERGVPASGIVLYGESLGSAVAARLAAEVEVGGLVLESAFTSIRDVAATMYPYLPVRWLMRSRYDTLGHLARVRAPVLLLHSRDDEFFPIRHAEALTRATGGRGRLVVLHGGHNDAFLTSEGAYRHALATFIAEGLVSRASGRGHRGVWRRTWALGSRIEDAPLASGE
jgi:pimeloyl-ACP methyl ester carboxylesterase